MNTSTVFLSNPYAHETLRVVDAFKVRASCLPSRLVVPRTLAGSHFWTLNTLASHNLSSLLITSIFVYALLMKLTTVAPVIVTCKLVLLQVVNGASLQTSYYHVLLYLHALVFEGNVVLVGIHPLDPCTRRQRPI
jgi:hypothetical protein